MGVLTQGDMKFKSAELLYSKIKREFKSFGTVNLLDDADFPLYTAEVLKQLGVGAYKEDDAVLRLRKGKAKLPNDFAYLYAAYKCSVDSTVLNGTSHLQNSNVYYNDITCEVLRRNKTCQFECQSTDKILERITVKQYVKEGVLSTCYSNPVLLRLSPNVRDKCVEDCLNLHCKSDYEISINNGYLFTNFNDADIYIQYYAFPYDEDNMPMIPDVIEIEKSVEWYIKWQILLNMWFTDELSNALNKWQKAEEQYNNYMGAARYIIKLPSFSQMINSIKNSRGINKTAAFSNMDNKRL